MSGFILNTEPALGQRKSQFLEWTAGLRYIGIIMPKIPEISVGIQMERFVSVSSDRNNIPTEIRRFIFVKPVLSPIN